MNITPANRLNTVSEYYFSTKLKEVAEMNARGENVISLGVGSPDLPPSEQTVETLAYTAKEANAHGYQPYVGIPELRKSFADFYKRWFDVSLNPANEIQPLIGSKEGILHISMAFLNAGDAVLVPNPGYPTYASVSNLVEAKIIKYDLLETNGWQPDFEALEKLDLSRVKLMWVNYPNMPTGAPATRELYTKLVKFGQRHSIIIVNDNPYSFILNPSFSDKNDGEKEFLSILQIEGAKDICIELNSMSKSHNMPGWRMGMLASNAQFVEWVLKVKSNIDSGQFRPMQLAAVSALQNTAEWHCENNYNIYKKRREIGEQIMTTLGCSFDPRQTGMFLWGKIPENYTNAVELADKTLYNAKVFVVPGSVFGTNGERYIRISLCANEEKLKEALIRLKVNF